MEENDEKFTVVIKSPEDRRIPREFVAWLSEYGFSALKKYLLDSAAPDQIMDLLEAMEGLAALQENDSGEGSEEWFGPVVAKLSRGFHFSGIELHGVDSIIKV